MILNIWKAILVIGAGTLTVPWEDTPQGFLQAFINTMEAAKKAGFTPDHQCGVKCKQAVAAHVKGNFITAFEFLDGSTRLCVVKEMDVQRICGDEHGALWLENWNDKEQVWEHGEAMRLQWNEQRT